MDASKPMTKIGRMEAHEHQLTEYEGRAYPGGSVWRTAQDAQAFIDTLPTERHQDWMPEDFSAYQVDASWEDDTYQHEGSDPFRSLLRDAKIVGKVSVKYST